MAFHPSEGDGAGGRGQHKISLLEILVYTGAGGIAGGLSCAPQVLRWTMRRVAMPHAVRKLQKRTDAT